jgi:diguanylate cyclase (GGDEF)-like protein
MIDLDDIELKKIICHETSSFALSIIDVESFEVIYANDAMKEFMVIATEKKCWKSIYGQNTQCSWCGVKNIINSDDINRKVISEYEHEYFNEKTNKWYKVQNKITKLSSGKIIQVVIALDISSQKEAQGKFITTQVKLVQQTQKLEKAHQELKLLASIDPLTKLYNRRYFIELSEPILDLAKRNNTNTAVIMLDIDKFKNVNDTYGHNIGDEVLVALALKLQEISRKSDVASRWGGEEFLILLPNTDINGALIIAEKIRQNLEELVIDLKDEKKLQFTVSVGVSPFDKESNDTLQSAINRADEALYKAKESGRNRVCS